MEVHILHYYISVWNWEILSFMFLCTSIILFSLPRTTHTSIFYVVFFLLFVATQFVAIVKKKILLDQDDN